jgi:ubiquinone/menaquinone biosynthesis C-methylase UbiE
MVGAAGRPETIERDWDRFYLEFPDVYDRFAVTSVAIMPHLCERYPLDGTVVLDVASGTGRSTFELARWARNVIGLEPWDSMVSFARQRQRELGINNVSFVQAAAEAMPFAPQSIDHAVSVFGFPVWFPEAGAHGQELGRRFVADCRRIVKPGGWVVAVGAPPSQIAGELTSIVAGSAASVGEVGPVERYMADLGFQWWDVDVAADYGTVAEAVATYGFIFGRRAIEHLRTHQISRIGWRLRVFEQRIDG